MSVKLLRGDLREAQRIESTNPVQYLRCEQCGSLICALGAGGAKAQSLEEAKFIAVPTMNFLPDGDMVKIPEDLRPKFHVFYKHRIVDIPDGLPKFEEGPDSTPVPDDARL